jgi:outer membrane protein assembly factor BamB
VPLRDQFVAASLTDGKMLWATELPLPDTPVTGGGLVYLMSDERLCAVSPTDGSVLWSIALGGRPSAPLVWESGWLFAATGNAELFAVRASDGELQWRRALGTPLRARAVPASDRVYVSLEDGRVAALDIHTGETVWERPLGGTPADILALADRIFVGSKDNFFYCLEARTGKVRWRWRTGADVIGAPIVDEFNVYFISLDNVLRALDRNRGGLRWQRGLEMRASGGPVLLEDALIVPGVAAEFSAFSVKSGLPVGTFRAKADLAAPPYLHVKPSGEVSGQLDAAPPAGEEKPSASASTKAPVRQIIVITREGGLEALVRAPAPRPGPRRPGVAGQPPPPADEAPPADPDSLVPHAQM